MAQDQHQTRLNKYLSDTGICSRREADKLIEQGRVTVNGIKPEVGLKVSGADQIKIDGQPVRNKEKAIYIALNKPVGITCTTEGHVKGNIVDFINHEKRIFPIGRLDKPSEGLIFLTNDGDIVNKILRAGNNHEKEYVVEVNKPVTADFIKKMGNGIPILDTVTQKCFVKQEGSHRFRIILTQGLNRQIRRMCEYLGYEVTKLKRTRIMNISLADLPTGKWRYLSEKEISIINSLVEDSVKTEEGSQIPAPATTHKRAPQQEKEQRAAPAYKARPESFRRSEDQQNSRTGYAEKKGSFTPGDGERSARSAYGKPARSAYGKPARSTGSKPEYGSAAKTSRFSEDKPERSGKSRFSAQGRNEQAEFKKDAKTSTNPGTRRGRFNDTARGRSEQEPKNAFGNRGERSSKPDTTRPGSRFAGKAEGRTGKAGAKSEEGSTRSKSPKQDSNYRESKFKSKPDKKRR
jgi:23S rRNA pseudouridine2604 synthase